jgi:peptidoglycan/xylan/chitin deacetylase (PgdA/CDA1 family)
MIGVIGNPADRDVICEFFELFKTPWEFYRPELEYDVLLCAGDGEFDAKAKLLLLYSGRRTHFDDQQQIQTGRLAKQSCVLSYQKNRIPIYGDSVTFLQNGTSLLTEEGSEESAAYLDTSGDRTLARIGYDLFGEVRKLLTVGQPHPNANLPTLDLHIEFLRDLITGCGVSLVEIPPVPEGFQFVACLTHDVDHPSVRLHKLDHTIIGFLARATFGSLVDGLLGRMSIRDAAKNWVAAVKLPFVYMGLAKDFWSDFDDRYLEIEKGLPSTFFVIPRKNYAGKRVDARAAALRPSCYAAKELADTICKLRAAGREVGLHGIDAWVDSASGREELEEIRRLTGVSEIGVRMHWLYYDEQSPTVLERAEAAYDSTIGYNETVGYRAGTTQVYKPIGVERLLELPLHAMDTALFYLSYLGLSPRKASARLRQMADNALRFGGTLTINWHDRSLAPERLWGRCYVDLIQDLRSRGAWFSTAGQAVSWFRKRRSAAFESDTAEPGQVRAKVSGDQRDDLPRLRLRIHNARKSGQIGANRTEAYNDIAVNEGTETIVASESRR